MSEIQLSGLVIFALTYALISARRLSWIGLDRPAGALLGAVACVVFGVLRPEEAIEAVDGATLLLLLGVMGMGAFLELDGFFAQIEGRLASQARSRARLLGMLIWGSGLFSALITNDAVCVLGAPLVVRLIRRYQLPPLPFLLALATSANTGSAATLVGNPQNMLCAALGGLSYREHLLLAAPGALACLGINHGLLLWIFRRELRGALPEAPPPDPLSRSAKVTLGVIGATALAYTLGADLAWSAAAGFVALMLLHRRDTRQVWARIDWSLLLFFSGLFIAVEGLQQSGAPAWLFARYPLSGLGEGVAGWLALAGISLVGSNIVSNVPFILVIQEPMGSLSDPLLGWEILAMASTFAGNLTLLGSVANIIVAESARDLGGIGFLEHLKVGLPLALLSTLVGTLSLLLFWGL